MIVFIDEGGHFTSNAGISVLCSLTLPSARAESAAQQIASTSERWPTKDGELKGGLLNKSQLTALISILFRHDALLHCHGTDIAAEDQGLITAHKVKQCDGLTKYLLPTHPEDLIRSVTALRETLEKMPNQLYVQFVLLSDVVMTTADHAAMYFSQRRPEELGHFAWIIDAKDPKRVSVQEAWWRDTLGPLGESKSRVHPFLRIDDGNFDYSYFDKSYAMTKEIWLPDRPRETVDGVDIGKLITESVTFADSRSNVLLQAVDILANFMRRTLNGDIADDDIARQLGRLQILQNQGDRKQSINFASFSDNPKGRKGLGRINGLMTQQARTMIYKGFASQNPL
jgi:hypothetical protein